MEKGKALNDIQPSEFSYASEILEKHARLGGLKPTGKNEKGVSLAVSETN
jgi:hypothetical protein